MAQVILKNVQKKYGKVDAVKNLDLECKDKEFLALLGPSGCGKSSTLRMIAGLEEASAGDILIDGVRVNDIHPSKRDIAMVFESYALYPHKTVFENMAYPLRVRRMGDEEIKSRVQRAAQILDIEALLQRYPRQLSGGQKQRVAIGRAIVRNPKVFLMDEPISHLDAKLRSHMRGELKHLQKELDQTFIYVTHDQTEAMSMADHIAVMNSGVLQQFGTPEMIFNHPVNAFVAGFVGDPPMNFIPCLLFFERGGWHLKHDAFTLCLGDQMAVKIKDKGQVANGPQEVILGVRPEAVFLKTEKGKPDDIPGNIYITEPMGSCIIVDVQVGKERLRVKADAHFKGDAGDRVFAEVSQDDFHLFCVRTTCSLG